MKTLTEVSAWIEGAESEFDDPAIPVGQLFARYLEGGPHDEEEVYARWQDGMLWLSLPWGSISLPVSLVGPRVDQRGALEAFGLEDVAPGLRALTPSLNIPGELHTFVVVYNVPTPAPWVGDVSCEDCGCTQDRACIDVMTASGCEWAIVPTLTQRGLCTVCDRKSTRAAQQAGG